ncbi:MAG: nucleoside hydrolase [Planctomycetota bacterium]
MPRRLVLDCDPGVGDALAICVALRDPRLEVAAITATGGCVPPARASHNVQAIVERLDPSPRPRLGQAPPDQALRTDARDLYGPDGLCGQDLEASELQHRRPSAKVLADEVRSAGENLTIVTGGPLTNIAQMLQGEPDLATRIGHLVIAGGTVGGPGNVTPAAEFNVYCDAESARQVLHSPITMTLVPLDVTSRVVLGMDILDRLTVGSPLLAELLCPMLTGAFRAYRRRLGVEGMFMHELVALAAAVHPEIFTTERLSGDVETSGDLTYGATVFDRRQLPDDRPNLTVAVDVDEDAVMDFVLRGLV